MILIKTLIIIFILLLLAKYAKPILTFFSNLLDGREGFDVKYEVEGVGDNMGENDEEEVEELVYTTPSLMDKHNKVADNTKFVGELQDKMNELTQLSEQASEINNQFNLNNFKDI